MYAMPGHIVGKEIVHQSTQLSPLHFDFKTKGDENLLPNGPKLTSSQQQKP
jgi:hypothetical protein